MLVLLFAHLALCLFYNLPLFQVFLEDCFGKTFLYGSVSILHPFTIFKWFNYVAADMVHHLCSCRLPMYLQTWYTTYVPADMYHQCIDIEKQRHKFTLYFTIQILRLIQIIHRSMYIRMYVHSTFKMVPSLVAFTAEVRICDD
jgi:hypothetical protein